MIIHNNKAYRNLEEQVGYLSDRIKDGIDIVKNVVDRVDSYEELPASAEVGDTYAVGEESPYHYYVWTESEEWVDLGQFPASIESVAVTSVNGQTGSVVLKASDINANNTVSIQGNLERIDGEVEDIIDTLTPTGLSDLIIGSSTVVVDVSQDEEHLQVSLDQDVTDAINGKLDATKTAVSNVGGLVIPTAVLASNELVGVSTSMAQMRIQIGSGLVIDTSTTPPTLKPQYPITNITETADAINITIGG